jgi:hypothetical protein
MAFVAGIVVVIGNVRPADDSPWRKRKAACRAGGTHHVFKDLYKANQHGRSQPIVSSNTRSVSEMAIPGQFYLSFTSYRATMPASM